MTVTTMPVTLTGEDIEFQAALGPLGIFIRDSEAQGGSFANLAANLNLGLLDGIFTNNRVLLSDIDFGSAFDANLTGTLAANLPVFFPTESISKGPIQLGAALAFGTGGIELNGTLAGGEYIIIPDDLFGIDLSQFSLLDNILLAIDGVDAFLAGLQDLLDGEIFGVSLPLVGDQLSSAAQFIEDFRKDFIDPLRDEVGNLTDPDQNFISAKFFELLGPGGLNILKDSDEALHLALFFKWAPFALAGRPNHQRYRWLNHFGGLAKTMSYQHAETRPRN